MNESRMSMAACRAPIVAVALAAMLLAGCDKEATLHSGLGERQANLVMAALLDSGISCRKTPGEEGTWNVLCSEAKFAQAVNLLERQGLPREPRQGIGEVFKKTGMISSPSEERIRFMDALAQDIARTRGSGGRESPRCPAGERPLRAQRAPIVGRGRDTLALERRHNRPRAVREGPREERDRGTPVREDTGDDIPRPSAGEVVRWLGS